MKEFLAHFRKARTTLSQSDVPDIGPQPDQAFLAVGDVHGRYDLLVKMAGLIEARYHGWPIVFLGDYVDRGEQSREVIEYLMSVSGSDPAGVSCLMGNHERMLLDFLDFPVTSARRWLRYGGLQTLASFGVSLPKSVLDDPAALETIRDDLAAKMGDSMIGWLQALPLRWRSGDVWAVHAGADPERPMDLQSREVLLWGHPRFRRRPREDRQWIVHGHTVVEAPFTSDKRIAVDTGAYATGCLSAAAISSEGVTFLQAGPERIA